MLELIKVSKSYPAQPQEVRVLSEINLRIEPAQTVSIVGPSGSGKTTLLNMMGGLDRPTSGKIKLNQKNLASLKNGELARLRNQHVGDRKSTRLNSSHSSPSRMPSSA